jgi:hypothetical protein
MDEKVEDEGEKTVKLSEPARRAIRAYMLKVVTPSAIVLSAISAVIGYLINEGARGNAYTTAYGQALSSIVATTQSTTLARSQAESLLEDTKKTVKDISALKEAVTAQKSEVDNFLKMNFEGVSQKLLGDEKFKTSLARVGDERFKALDNLVTVTRESLTKTSSDTRSVPGNVVRCPDGYYLIGIAFQDQSGLAHGALWGPTGTCAKLNVGSVSGR